MSNKFINFCFNNANKIYFGGFIPSYVYLQDRGLRRSELDLRRGGARDCTRRLDEVPLECWFCAAWPVVIPCLLLFDSLN